MDINKRYYELFDKLEKKHKGHTYNTRRTVLKELDYEIRNEIFKGLFLNWKRFDKRLKEKRCPLCNNKLIDWTKEIQKYRKSFSKTKKIH